MTKEKKKEKKKGKLLGKKTFFNLDEKLKLNLIHF